MRILCTLVALSLRFLSICATEAPTHDKIKEVKLKGENGGTLRTIAPAPNGEIVALVGMPPDYSNDTMVAQAAKATEVYILDAEGIELSKWALDFAGQSIGVGPDGSIYVGGDGKIAKYNRAGKLLVKLEIPHITEVLKDDAKIREMAEAYVKSQCESYEETIQSYSEQVKALRDKAESRLTAEERKILETFEKEPEPGVKAAAQAPWLTNGSQFVPIRTKGRADFKLAAGEKVQLQQLESQQRQCIHALQRMKEQEIDVVLMSQRTARLRTINSIAATEKEIFFVCGELKGYGYSVWRMDTEFKNPVQVLSKLGGCCGQMDIQVSGGRMVVAENTKHRVGQYDLTGKPLGSFGKAGRDASIGDTFGGCCNPMNCRLCANGEVYTSESEGIIKKFNAKGEFLGLIGAVTLTGGCKNVAIAVSPAGDLVYLCDLPGSKIVILNKRSAEEMKAAEEEQKKSTSLGLRHQILFQFVK